ncbi:hypothetical protein VIGAN_01248600 [Vigna angularis var. angularis]|uniref:Uncharacterized protein n=1 Tax=Vigna angularis var. angularis TaxID=157739 RepID=A0A0S3R2C3_PHAAN|nr:hypothetical protein VIGAN_01248600 [Vigna angularis var. angularis]
MSKIFPKTIVQCSPLTLPHTSFTAPHFRHVCTTCPSSRTSLFVSHHVSPIVTHNFSLLTSLAIPHSQITNCETGYNAMLRTTLFYRHHDEICRCIQILSRSTNNNLVLIGEPGVGKTAISEGNDEECSSWNECA